MRVSVVFTSFLLTATTFAAPYSYGDRLYTARESTWAKTIEQLTALQEVASTGTDADVRLAAHNAGLDKFIKPQPGRYGTHGLQSLIKDIGLNLMAPFIPANTMKLIRAVRPEHMDKLMSNPGKLLGMAGELRSGKLPLDIPGVPQKELMNGVLTNMGVPKTALAFIDAAPASFMTQITSLTADQLIPIIETMAAGKLPTIPGSTKADMILGALPSLGLPSLVVDILKATPGTIEQLGELNFEQLDKMLVDFKAGKFTGIPGLNVTPIKPKPSGTVTPTKPTGVVTPTKPIGTVPVGTGLPATPVGTNPAGVLPVQPVASGPAGALPVQPVASNPAGTLPIQPVASNPAGALPIQPVATGPASSLPIGGSVQDGFSEQFEFN
ncbi:hypothetical protein TWF718_007113 [Orbilia javanica]|uniref:Uncharacterized protein n=1 Tax=Orbilia javanica TaxID=47235 RepID=A0AAN8NVI6_9PEZI